MVLTAACAPSLQASTHKRSNQDLAKLPYTSKRPRTNKQDESMDKVSDPLTEETQRTDDEDGQVLSGDPLVETFAGKWHRSQPPP